MNHTTELIQAIAQQVVTVVQAALSEQTDPQASMNLAWIETGLRDTLRQIGAEALSQWLSAAQLTPETERPCACGGTLRDQRFRSATLVSVFGRVTSTRAYSAGCPCGRGCAPLDEA